MSILCAQGINENVKVRPKRGLEDILPVALLHFQHTPLSVLFSQCLIHLTVLVLILILPALTNNFPCGAISNVVLKTRKIRTTTFPLSSDELLEKSGKQGLSLDKNLSKK